MKSTSESLPLSLQREIDAVCDRFENVCKDGPPPRMESWLGEVSEPARPALLRRLVQLETDYRRRRCPEPSALKECAGHASLRPAALARRFRAAAKPANGTGPAGPGNDRN